MRGFAHNDHAWLTKQTLVLFGIAVAARVVSSAIQIAYGQHRLPGLALNNWTDFYGIYVHWWDFLQHGLLPYRDIESYKYPPLFLYAEYPFFVAGGAHAAAIPMVAADAGTAVLVFLIARRFGGPRIGFAAGLAYALSPFILYEADYLWLSSQPMTFFMLLAVYLLEEDKPVASIAVLAVSAMFKQQALFIIPAYLIIYAKRHGPEVPKGLAVFLAVVIVVSLPFLILMPIDYLYGVDYLPPQLILNLGPREPSLPIASQIINSFPPPPPSLSAAGPIYASFLGILDRMANVLNPLLWVLLAPVLYVVRRSPNFLAVLCAYSSVAFLAAYSDLVAPTYAYYFVPVYALIFASVSNLRILAVGVATTLVSLIVPEGPFEAIPPLVCLMLIAALQDRPQLSG